MAGMEAEEEEEAVDRRDVGHRPDVDQFGEIEF